MLPQRTIFILYFFVLASDLGLLWLQSNELRWFTKPLLLLLLMLVVWRNRKQIRLFTILLAALLFSWAGDVFLLMKQMFIPGLASFLAAHVCYIFYFLKIQPAKKGLLQFQPLIGIPVVVYILLFLVMLYPFLDTLKIPVTVYGITIGLMLLMSINMKRKLNDDASSLFFNGALQFVISDSLLAVNLFAYPSTVISLCVMLTYASAQYLLVRGAMLAHDP
jgi:uncharacterized membrane protein YhhN